MGKPLMAEPAPAWLQEFHLSLSLPWQGTGPWCSHQLCLLNAVITAESRWALGLAQGPPVPVAFPWLLALLLLPPLSPSLLLLGHVTKEGYGRIRNVGRFSIEPVPLCRPLGLAASCFPWTKGSITVSRVHTSSSSPSQVLPVRGPSTSRCSLILALMNVGS